MFPFFFMSLYVLLWCCVCFDFNIYFFRIYMLHDVWDFLDTVFVSLLFQFAGGHMFHVISVIAVIAVIALNKSVSLWVYGFACFHFSLVWSIEAQCLFPFRFWRILIIFPEASRPSVKISKDCVIVKFFDIAAASCYML